MRVITPPVQYHILSHPVCHQSASTQGQCELQLMASYAMKTVT